MFGMSYKKIILIIILLLIIGFLVAFLYNKIKKQSKKVGKKIIKLNNQNSNSKSIETYQNDNIINLDTESPVTWVNTWQQSPEFLKYKLKPFFLDKNNLYISDMIFKFNPILGPFNQAPDETSVFIFTNYDPNSSILEFRNKKQLITYGFKDNCNVPQNTSKDNYSALCRGIITLESKFIEDKYNTQFEQKLSSKGIPFLQHKPTKLMVCYITVTKELLDAVNMYPIDNIQAPFNTFYISDIPDLSFNIGTYMQPGDIVPLVYVGNGLVNDIPKIIQIQLSNKYIKTVNPGDTFGYTTKKFDVVLNNYSKLTTNGNWIIQVLQNSTSISTSPSNFITKRLYYLPFGKFFILRTKPDIEDGTSDWEFAMPGLSTNCSSSQIYFNGQCTDCPQGQNPNSFKTDCLPDCPPGTYLFSNSCQKCEGIVTSDKLNCLTNGKLVGKVYQNRPYEVQMEDGTFISVTDLLTFIAGPDENGSNIECFRYQNENNQCSLDKPWNCIVEGAEWILDRAKDVGTYLKNAVEKVGSWAKNVGSAALEWAKNAGKNILEGLIKIGNSISCAARKVLRDISSFFSNIFEQMKNAVTTTFNYIKNKFLSLVDKIWGTIKTPLSMAISFYLDSVQCDYLNLRENYPDEKKDAIQLLEPYFVPNIRTGLVAFVSELLIVATEGVIAPIINVILPLVSDYIYPKIDGLIIDLLEKEQIINSILSTTDVIISKISFSCDWLKPPDDVDDLKGDVSKLTDTNIVSSN
jgi:hypothetical protein